MESSNFEEILTAYNLTYCLYGISLLTVYWLTVSINTHQSSITVRLSKETNKAEQNVFIYAKFKPVFQPFLLFVIDVELRALANR